VDQWEQSRLRRTIGQLLRWRPTRTQLLWAGGIAALVFLIIGICGYLFGWKWTGLPKQTLWDWLKLLIIPAVLAGVGLWFNRQQREQELQTADRRAQNETLQAYLDQMSGLLLEKDLRASEEDSEVRTLARARTLTVLSRLDPSRKTAVMQFLVEAKLVHRVEEREPIIRLADADLSGADLIGADLSRANLSGTHLFGADLRGAYLIGAKGWTEEQLSEEARSLEGATMPNGQQYEDWLKSRGKGDSATPEQEGGPWWGGPYHRRGIWRRLFGG
jgi:Pentapeptide repeats (8 copies)